MIDVPGITLIRKDRSNSNGVRGGGVALYIDNEIYVKPRLDLSNSSFECLWAVLRPKWLPRKISRLAVAVVYLPPSMSLEDLELFYDFFFDCYYKLISESSNTSFIVADDFNPATNRFQPKYIEKQCHLKQIVKEPSRGANILDLIPRKSLPPLPLLITQLLFGTLNPGGQKRTPREN